MGSVLDGTGNRFTFRQYRCKVLKDIFHDDDGHEHYNLKLREDLTKTYLFAYAPLKGLVMVNEKTGQSVNHSDAVGAFLSMTLSDVDEVIAFIEKYGFFFSLSSEQFVSVSFDELSHHLIRLKMVIHLFLRLIDPNAVPDYNEMLLWTFRLLLGRPKGIQIESREREGKLKIEPCIHPINRIWYSSPEEKRILCEEDDGLVTHRYPEIPFQGAGLEKSTSSATGTKRLTGACVPTVLREELLKSRDPDDEYFPVKDTFSNTDELISCIMYHEIMGDIGPVYELSDPAMEEARRFRARLAFLYVEGASVEQSEREIIDFLIHLYDQVSRLEFHNEWDLVLPEALDLNTLPAFHKRFKEVLIKLVKRTVKEELDYVLSEVHPVYDMERMEADWDIPNLFTAMCFSVFYMKPNQWVYRLCENPMCKNMFEVPTTNTKKKFCSMECQQAVAKKKWYQKKKLKEQGNRTEESRISL